MVNLTPTQALLVHSACEWLAIIVGVQLYRYGRSQPGALRVADPTQELLIILGAALGAALGSKLAFLAYDPAAVAALVPGRDWLLGGQSIVGGLLGGLLGVEGAKRLTGVTASTGDAFVVPILVALIIGRIGCFLAGLADATYGNPTALPWGYNFGDGIPRHPTQIYDQLFALALLVILAHTRPRLRAVAGLEFKLMLASYLAWRLLIDALKPRPIDYLGGLSGIQLVCLVALLAYSPALLRAVRQLWYPRTEARTP
ncbi:MAG: prolipoprotein diacylglyceryl transferase family protein [Steroidobacteraceae bacterium]